MKPILTFILLTLSIVAQAVTIPPSKAKDLASLYIATDKGSHVHSTQLSTQLSLAHTATDRAGNVDYYAFNLAGNNGYVLVSGEDSTLPIIGYSDSGTFDINDVPESMQWWLSERQHEIEYLRQHPEQARGASAQARAVAPLITSKWNQSAPFNKYCPSYVINYTARRCPTGCVATAMAQIMNYHKWPDCGTGEHSYSLKINFSTSETTLYANYAASHYDWDKMEDIYTSNSSIESENAVAQLMSDVGISVNMSYGTASGAFSPEVVTALKTYFKYDPSVKLHAREQYSIDEWENLIRTELDNNRPVYYSGMTSTSGHAFVCDGYDQNGYFHFNWGWGGKSDGYFVLSMLTPSAPNVGSYDSGYNTMQSIITNIMPDRNSGTTTSQNTISGTTNISTAAKSIALGKQVSINITSTAITGINEWETMYWGVALTSADINTPQLVQAPTSYADASTISPGGGYSMTGLKFTPATTLKDGKYYVRLMYLINETLSGYFMGTTPSNYVIDMEVKNGTAYFSKHYEACNVAISNLQMMSPNAYKDQMVVVKADITNNTDNEVCDYFNFAIRQGSTTSVNGDAILVAIKPHETFTLKTAVKTSAAQGNYTLALLNSSKQVLASTPVTIIDGGGTVNMNVVQNVVPKSNQMPANDVYATAVVTNNGGTFQGPIELFITNESNIILNTLTSDIVTVKNGENITVSFHGEFAGKIGETYYLALRNPNPAYASQNLLWDILVPFIVSEPSRYHECDVNHDGDIDVADINAVISILMNMSTHYIENADVNHDGDIDVADINCICAALMH